MNSDNIGKVIHWKMASQNPRRTRKRARRGTEQSLEYLDKKI